VIIFYAPNTIMQGGGFKISERGGATCERKVFQPVLVPNPGFNVILNLFVGEKGVGQAPCTL
jgi:hypothetical protein